MRLVRIAVIAASVGCSTPEPVLSDDFYCGAVGPPLALVSNSNEHFGGTAIIGALQNIEGGDSVSIMVCGVAGEKDVVRLEVIGNAPDGAVASLPLAATDTITFPFAGAIMHAFIGGVATQAAPTSGELTVSGGHISGSLSFGDAGVSVTIDGSYAFGCSTNKPDPNFETTFCKQFIALAP